MMFKLVVCIAAGLVLGYALGGIPARREVASLREERDALKSQLADAARPNLFQALLPGLAPPRSAANDPFDQDPRAARPREGDGREVAVDPRPDPRGDVVVIGADRERAQNATGAPLTAPARRVDSVEGLGPERTAAPDEARREGPRGPRNPEEMLERFDQLVTAQRMRSAAARSALVEQAGLKPEELQRVDSAVTRMNQKLEGYGQEVITQAASEKPPSPSQALGLGHDVSGILFEGQQELEAVVGGRAEDVDPKALEIWNYVDVEQWRPYVQQELQARQQGQTGPGSAPAPGGGQAGAAPQP